MAVVAKVLDTPERVVGTVDVAPIGEAVPGSHKPAVIAQPSDALLDERFGDECPACGDARMHTLFRSTDRLYRTTTDEFYVVECSNCRLIRLHPQPPPHELRNYYPQAYWFSGTDSTAARLEEEYRRLVLRDHVNFVTRAVRECEEEGILLDVGCGGGLFLRMLSERGFPGFGLDFSLDAAGTAWREHGIPTVCATLTKSPFEPGTCAAITMFHVLEHLYDPGAYLEAAHRLLKPDGRLVVQVPNASCWQFLMFGKAWNGVDVPRHLIDFKQKDLDGLLDACGFEVLRHKHFSLRDNPAGLATTLAPSLDPMARRVRGDGASESPRMKLFKDLLYLGLVIVSIPFTLVEAICHSGSTIMVEARKKP